MRHSILLMTLFGTLALSVGVSGVYVHAGAADQSAVSIATDQDKGTITFIIDGKAVAQINRDGLQVVESINYGGILSDTGSAHVQKIIAQGGETQVGGHDQ